MLLVFPVRTNKFITRHMPGFIRAAVVELLLGIALLATGVVLAVADYRRSMFAALRMSGMLFAVVWVWHQTRHTFRLTRALEDKDRNGRPRCALRRGIRGATALLALAGRRRPAAAERITP